MRDSTLIAKLIFFSIVLVALVQFGTLAGAQSAPTGVSHFVSSNSTIVYLNGSGSIPFSLNLVSGTSGTTYLILANQQALTSNGVNVELTPGSGIPTFNGTIYINTNTNTSKVVAGVYKLEIGSGGADPISQGIYNITLIVEKSNAPATTTSTASKTTISSTIAQANSTSTINSTPSGKSSGFPLLAVAAVIVILIILTVLWLVLRHKK